MQPTHGTPDSTICAANAAPTPPVTGETDISAHPKRRTVQHFRRPPEEPFTRAEREHVTLLFGGLTRRHDRLIQAALQGIGYRAEPLAVPTKRDYHTGREYGDNGMCNPTYFTAGALINHLKSLRDRRGLSTDDIVRDYVFLTAGGCGPCRFGMYEAEYRLALRNSGFDRFRVLLFEQRGLRQSGPHEGVEFNPELFVGFLTALVIGDLLNEIASQLRPYEVEPGAVERTLDEVVGRIAEHLRAPRKTTWRGHASAFLLGGLVPDLTHRDRLCIVEHLFNCGLRSLLRDCGRYIDETVQVDFTRPKPVCKLIGEFWAQTTEGDGNFNIQTFLESQGAEVLPEPITTWANYIIAQERAELMDNRTRTARSMRERIREAVGFRVSLLRLRLALFALNREYERYRKALGGSAHPQVDQRELARLARPFYNNRLLGGEGHLEVAKTIHYTTRNLAHMILSLKPFGCLPSTQSDGAQAAVLARYPQILFLPVETSGEGDVNAYSRVQMVLGEAKARCREEFNGRLAQTGYSLEDIRRYCGENPGLRRPFQPFDHKQDAVGRAAKFVQRVALQMDTEPLWSARKRQATTTPAADHP